MVFKIFKHYGIVLFAIGVIIFSVSDLNLVFAGDDLVSQTQIKIIVKETSQINQAHIFLGQIATIYATDFLKESLAKIDLGASPKPDKIKFLDKKKIISAIRGQQYLPEDIKIISPERVYVKRLGQRVSEENIRQFIDQHLSKMYKNKEYTLTSFRVRGLELYPQGAVAFTLLSNDIIGQNGRMSALLEVKINGERYDKLSVTGQIAIYENVLCLTRSFPKGKMITREDVYLKKMNIYDLSDNFMKDLDALDQKILKTSMKKDNYLRTNLIESPPLIQKGDFITLISKNETLVIVTSGISKEDGFKNESIRVENLSSGKAVQGVVKSKSKVEVEF